MLRITDTFLVRRASAADEQRASDVRDRVRSIRSGSDDAQVEVLVSELEQINRLLDKVELKALVRLHSRYL